MGRLIAFAADFLTWDFFFSWAKYLIFFWRVRCNHVFTELSFTFSSSRTSFQSRHEIFRSFEFSYLWIAIALELAETFTIGGVISLFSVLGPGFWALFTKNIGSGDVALVGKLGSGVSHTYLLSWAETFSIIDLSISANIDELSACVTSDEGLARFSLFCSLLDLCQ